MFLIENKQTSQTFWKGYKKEINNVIERCLKFYNSIDHVYKQSPIDDDSLNISIWRLFFANRKTSSMQMMIFTMTWSQLPLVVIMQR